MILRKTENASLIMYIKWEEKMYQNYSRYHLIRENLFDIFSI